MKPIRRDHLFVTLRLVRSMSNLKQRLHTLGHRVLSFQPHCPINRTKISPLCNIILWYFSPSIIKTHTFKFQLFSPPHGSQIQITGTLSLSTEWEMLCPLSSSSLCKSPLPLIHFSSGCF